MSIFSKMKTLAKGTVHDLLDKAIDMNSPTMLRQYARDLQDSLDDLTSEAATAAGAVRTQTRERDGLNSSIETLKASGTRWKNGTDPNKDTHMAAIAKQIVTLRANLATKEKTLADAKTASTQLDSVVESVKAKSGEINARIHQLESMDASSKAKEHAASVIKDTANLLANEDGASIDSIQAKIQARSDVADVKLERAMGEYNSAFVDNTDHQAVNDVLNEF